MNTPSEAPKSSPDETASRMRLSALADGEVGRGLGDEAGKQGDALDQALSSWRTDPSAREAWHSYQLIGDVLRSEDLARAADEDLAFLSRFRERLDAEPVHTAVVEPAARVAPVVTQPASASPARWAGRRSVGVAMAASVAVAAVALLLTRAGVPGSSAEDAAATVAGTALNAADPMPPIQAPLAVNSAGVLRDPRLDEFLRLHQMARGGLTLTAPGGTLQRADLQMPVGANR